MPTAIQFDPIRLPQECEELRAEVREFVRDEIAAGTSANTTVETASIGYLHRNGEDRHDVAKTVWQPGAKFPRTLCRH